MTPEQRAAFLGALGPELYKLNASVVRRLMPTKFDA